MGMYEKYYERRTKTSFDKGDKTYKKERSHIGSYRGQWDKIICILCTGCKKPLGRYENFNRLAFCHSCREILFPETITPRDSPWRNAPY